MSTSSVLLLGEKCPSVRLSSDPNKPPSVCPCFKCELIPDPIARTTPPQAGPLLLLLRLPLYSPSGEPFIHKLSLLQHFFFSQDTESTQKSS